MGSRTRVIKIGPNVWQYFHMPAFMQKLVIVELTLAHVQLAKQLRAPDQEGSKDPGVKSQLAYDFSTMNASDSVEH